MAIFIASVAAGADDATERVNATGFDATGVMLSALAGDNNARKISGMRIANVTIPRGATIITATMDVQVLSTFLDSPNLHIYCEDVDDAVDFTANADVATRVKTAESTAWTAADIPVGVRTSPDFAPALQAVIDRPGRVSGQAIMVLFEGDFAAASEFQWAAFEHATAAPAQINITYIPPLPERSFPRGDRRGVLRGVA